MRPRRVTRDAIMEVALPLFRERGYRSTRLEDIASALGVTQPALYDHFKSKEDILTEIHDQWWQGIMNMVDGVGSKDVPASAKFIGLLAMHVDNCARYPSFSYVAANELREVSPERAAVFRAHSKRFTDLLEDLYVQAVADGEFLDVDPAVAVRAIFGAANWISNWYRSEGRISPDELAEIFSRLLQNGFRRQIPADAKVPASSARKSARDRAGTISPA